MRLPNKPSRAVEQLAWAESIWEYLRSLTLRAGPGIQLHRSPSGITISVAPRRGRSGVQTPTLYLISGSAPHKVQVTPGAVNLEMPTLGTIALDAETTPEITITGPTEVWLKVVGTFDSPSDTYVATIEPSEASPSITATGFVSSRLLGTVALESDVAVITRVHQGGDLAVESFGSVNLWWKV